MMCPAVRGRDQILEGQQHPGRVVAILAPDVGGSVRYDLPELQSSPVEQDPLIARRDVETGADLLRAPALQVAKAYDRPLPAG